MMTWRPQMTLGWPDDAGSRGLAARRVVITCAHYP